jgi:hypothetical protein
MAALVSFSRWFGSFLLHDEPIAERSLAPPNVREERIDVKVVFSRQFLTGSVDLRNDWIFPHSPILP